MHSPLGKNVETSHTICLPTSNVHVSSQYVCVPQDKVFEGKIIYSDHRMWITLEDIINKI